MAVLSVEDADGVRFFAKPPVVRLEVDAAAVVFVAVVVDAAAGVAPAAGAAEPTAATRPMARTAGEVPVDAAAAVASWVAGGDETAVGTVRMRD